MVGEATPKQEAQKTPMPTTIPANTPAPSRSSPLTSSPSATKQHATQTVCGATPQQAAEKNPVFNAAANAPSTQAR